MPLESIDIIKVLGTTISEAIKSEFKPIHDDLKQIHLELIKIKSDLSIIKEKYDSISNSINTINDMIKVDDDCLVADSKEIQEMIDVIHIKMELDITLFKEDIEEIFDTIFDNKK
jgi:hypothetical protein